MTVGLDLASMHNQQAACSADGENLIGGDDLAGAEHVVVA